MSSNIEWTDDTWNPITGCTKCSAGCQNCYAERMAKRLKAIGQPQYQNVVDKDGWTGRLEFVPSALDIPRKRRKPTVFFVGSMTDVFHPEVEDAWLSDIYRTVFDCKWHKFIFLTKRPSFMVEEFEGMIPRPYIWLGASASTQDYLMQDYVHKPMVWSGGEDGWQTFLSLEPLLGPVTIPGDLLLTLSGVIVGGESGPRARPMHPDWVRSLRDQCAEAGVPFFFKQWGEWLPGSQADHFTDEYLSKRLVTEVQSGGVASWGFKVGKHDAGRKLDGREWNELPWGNLT